jgi:hypothetical protein
MKLRKILLTAGFVVTSLLGVKAQLMNSLIFDHNSDTTDYFDLVGSTSTGYGSIVNTFTLKVVHDTIAPDTAGFEVAVSFHLYELANFGQPVFYKTDTLSIDFKAKYDSIGYKNLDAIVIREDKSFRVYIEKVWVNGIEKLTVPTNVQLDMNFKNFSRQSMDVINSIEGISISPIMVNCDGVSSQSAFEVSWLPFEEALEYQLEWTFVNDYDLDYNAFKNISDPSLTWDFKKNSTRVTTKDLQYEIPNLFDHGYLIVRLRAVGIDTNYPDRYIYTNWSLANTGQVNDANTSKIQILAAHEPNKNWQVTTTFAEEGKKKEVISYFDGTLRNRQTVTRINSDDNVIVGETIYDYQGRPSINILPVPVVNDGCTSSAPIKYYENFNLVGGQPVHPIHFDQDAAPCEISAMQLDNSSGAALYYSSNNPDKSGAQAFVPESNGYPYTQVQYRDDNTGKIIKQSGVGEQFTIDSEHATEYIYTIPMQVELDRLFASEVGMADHYKKNVVIDPNGQASISYLDQEGRVIATALAGNVTENLEALPDYESATRLLTDDLLNKDINGSSSVNVMNMNGQIVLSSNFAVIEDNTQVNLTYNFEPTMVELNCMPENTCVTCAYRLRILVISECGDTIWHVGGDQGDLFGNFSINPNGSNSFLFTCTNAPNGLPVTFNQPLDKGTYSVYKILSIDEEAREFYLQAYLNNELNNCYIPFEDFLADQEALIDPSNCDVTCESCLESLGTIDDFILAGGTYEDYQLSLAECDALCIDYNPCFEPYEMMLADMSPGGQYAMYEVATNTDTQQSYLTFPGDNYKTSLFNPESQLPAKAQFADELWRHPKMIVNGEEILEYHDDGGMRYRIPVVSYEVDGELQYHPPVISTEFIFVNDLDLTQYTYPEYLRDVEEFANIFQESFAKSLVSYHPEYCYYDRCLNVYYAEDVNEWTSARLDSLLEASFDMELAMDNGFVDATTLTQGNGQLIVSFSINDWTDTPSQSSDPRDPFILNSANYDGFGAQLLSKWNNYTTINNIAYSMKEVAALIARTGNNVGPGATIEPWMTAFGSTLPSPQYTPEQNDEILRNEWSVLYNMYLSTKRELVYTYFDDYAMTCDDCRCFNDCMGKTSWHPVWYGFWEFYNVGTVNDPSPYFLMDQPCGHHDKHLYAQKQARWIQPNDIPEVAAGATASQNQLDYNLYINTGLCPIDFAFQNLINEAAANGSLTSSTTVEMQDFSTFGAYINVINDYYPQQSLADYNWGWQAISVSSSSLAIQVSNLDDGTVVCDLGFNKSHSWDWSEIVQLSGFNYTNFINNLYHFTIQAKVETNAGVFEWFTISGKTSCANLGTCTFSNECEPNALASQIVELLNGISVTDPVGLANQSSTTVDALITDGLGVTLSNHLDNSSSLVYLFNPNTNAFQISNSAGTRSIQLIFDEIIPLSYQLSSIPQGAYLFNFRSEFENHFAVDLMFEGNLLCELRGYALYYSNGNQSQLELGDCGAPQILSCLGSAYETGEHLEAWAYDLAINNYSNPLHSLEMTPLIESALSGFNQQFQFSETIQGGKKVRRYISEDCTIEVSLPNVSSFTSSNITGVEAFVPHGEPDADGNYYALSIYIYWINNGVEVGNEVIFSSCVPFKPCIYECATEETNTVVVNPPPVEKSKTVELYYKYADAVAQFNLDRGLNPSDSLYLETYSYASFYDLGLYFTAEQYIHKLKEHKVDIDLIEIVQNIFDFAIIYGNRVDPKFEWERYLKGVDKYNLRANDSNLPLLSPIESYVFFENSLADSLDSYLNYLEFVSNPVSAPISVYDYHYIVNYDYTIPVECEDMYWFYVNAYSIWEAGQLESGGCETFERNNVKQYSIEAFKEMKFCEDSLGYAMFEDYAYALLYSDGCIKPAYSKEEATYEIATINEKDCQRLFVTLRDYMGTYNSMYNGIYPPLSYNYGPLGSFFNNFEAFAAAGYCDCLPDYLNYLYSFIDDPRDPENSPAIHFFDYNCNGEVPVTPNPCEDAYLDYVNGIREFNTYLVQNQIRGWEVPISIRERDFVNKGFCDCLEEWLAYLESIKTAKLTQITPAMQHNLRLENFCDNQPPCEPEVATPNEIPDWPVVEYSNPCDSGLYSLAAQNAVALYEMYLADLTQDFILEYNSQCGAVVENFNFTKPDREFHYTLYYYDQAGNLIKTIPPAGVVPLEITGPEDPLSIAIAQDRVNHTQTVFTNHGLATTYVYNSLNQLVRQSLPDHNKMNLTNVSLPQQLPSNLKILDVEYITESNAWAVGNLDVDGALSGAVYKSSDGGLTWSLVNNILGMDITDMDWFDSNIAIAVGSFGNIIRTEDGGLTWKQMDNHGLTYKNLRSIEIVDANHFYVVGDNMTVLHSNDLGLTWSIVTPTGVTIGGNESFVKIRTTTNNTNFNDLVVISQFQSNGLDLSRIYTFDAGSTAWTERSFANYNWTSISANPNGDFVLTDSEGGLFYLSFASGSPVVETLPASYCLNIRDAYFSDRTHGVMLAGTNGWGYKVFETSDGGKTFTEVQGELNTLRKITPYKFDGTESKHLMHGGVESLTKLIGGSNWGQYPVYTDTPNNTVVNGVFADFEPGVSEIPAVFVSTNSMYYTLDVESGDAEWTQFHNQGSYEVICNRTPNFIKGLAFQPQQVSMPGNQSTSVTSFAIPTDGVTNATVTNHSQCVAAAMALNQTGNVAYTVRKDGTTLKFRVWNLGVNNATISLPAEITQGPASVPASELISGLAFASGKLVLTMTTGQIYYFNATATTVSYLPNPNQKFFAGALNDVAFLSDAIVLAGDKGDYFQATTAPNLGIFTKRPSLIADDITSLAIKGNKIIAATKGAALYQSLHSSPNLSFSQVYLSAMAGDELLEVTVMANELYVGASSGKVWRGTFAGGNNPANLTLLQNLGTNQPVNVISYRPDGTKTYIGGNNGFLRIAVNGSLSNVNAIYPKPLNNGDFTESGFGCVVGNNGMTRYTNNGGLTWSAAAPANMGQVDDLLDVAVNDNGTMKLAGNAGFFGRLENGLMQKESTGSTGTFNHVEPIVGSSEKFIVGGIVSSQAKFYLNTTSTTWSDVTASVQTSPAITSISSIKSMDRAGHVSITSINASNTSQITVAWLNTSATGFNRKNFTLPYASGVQDHCFIDDQSFVVLAANGNLYKNKLLFDLTVLNGPYQGAQLEAVNGLQSLNLVGTVFNSQPLQTSFDLKCIDFKNAYEGFVGGNYADGLNSSRLIFDMSGEFSTLFWYDKLGRIVVSQNTKQQFNQQYSYTLYDGLGRVMEAGQKDENDENEPQFLSIFGTSINGHYNTKAIDDTKLNDWIKSPSGIRRQVTRTLYDIPVAEAGGMINFAMNPPLTQTHMRKRVSAVFYQEEYEAAIRDYETPTSTDEDFNYQHATYYSYDIHGNVKTLVQDQPAMTIQENELASMRFKRMDYKYDLISGNVHDVAYQKGHEDAMHHHYRYDADNRITDVYTSTAPYPLEGFYDEGVSWTADASYSYYQHGPLARVQLGEQQVQGIDYAYTLQGWLKGVNSEDMQAQKDMGGDGKQAGVNQWVGSDVFSFSLGYYQGDYQRIDGNATDWQGPANGSLIAERHDLWNGNIGHMISNIAVTTGVTASPTDITGKLGMSYKYDQLNRIMQAKGSIETAGVWTPVTNDAYFNAFTYDENGNILTQKRKDHSGALIDDLTYHYHKIQGVLLQNRLYHVEDAAGALGSGGIGATAPVNLVGGNVDINNNNYRYTEIGELESDALEGIEEIIWRVDSKISEVRFVSSSGKDNLKFEYDAMGNRVAKYVMDGQTLFAKHVTYYVRDASGNVMAVYEHDLETPESYHLAERHIYGSSRVGMITEKVEFEYVYGNLPTEELVPTLAIEETVNFELEYSVGKKQYELSNHLGNVLAVISDWKLPVISGSTVVSYSTVVISSQDYSPFGVTLSGRSWSEGYRYGFNGQEKEKEITSSDSHTSAEFWMYDSRQGRRWQLDPKPASNISSYATFRLNPVYYSDPLGDTVIVGRDFENSRTFRQLRREWRKQTGLNVYVNKDGQLDYSKVRSGGQDVPTNYPKAFSATARAQLIQMITDPRTVELKEGDDTFVDRTNNIIYFNGQQIEMLNYNLVNNSPAMAEDAMSYGIVSYHEFDHWLNPGNNDPIPANGDMGPGQTLNTGPTVNFENVVRNELTQAGLGNYGQRTVYYMRVGRLKVITFDTVSRDQIIRTGSLMGVQNITFAVVGDQEMTSKELDEAFEYQPDFER